VSTRTCAHAARRWPLAIAAWVALGAVGGGTPAHAAPVPEPPLVVDAGATDGRLRVDPPTQVVAEDRATWVLTNGGAGPLALELAVHEVDATDRGVEVGDRLPVPLDADRLALEAGEAARVVVPLGEVTAPRALALVARTVDADPPTTVSGVALLGGGTVTPRVVGTDAAAGTLRLSLAADGPTLVDVAVRATAWPGAPRTEQVVEGVLVPADGRDLEVALAGPVAGRVTVEVAVAGPTPRRTRTAVWWWPRPVVATIAGVLLLVALLAALAVRRRSSRTA
jgi:hypothetical protein